MKNLAELRCFNHALREAVARCPECRRYFCRECITEHEDRIVCSACLDKVVRRSLNQQSGVAGMVRIGQCFLGLLAVWFFFYLVGQALLALPSSFHEGTVWEGGSGEIR